MKLPEIAQKGLARSDHYVLIQPISSYSCPHMLMMLSLSVSLFLKWPEGLVDVISLALDSSLVLALVFANSCSACLQLKCPLLKGKSPAILQAELRH